MTTEGTECLEISSNVTIHVGHWPVPDRTAKLSNQAIEDPVDILSLLLVRAVKGSSQGKGNVISLLL